MGGKRTSFDISVLVNKLRTVPGLLEKELKPLVEQQAKLFVEDMMKWTPPASKGVTGVKAKKQGESAVARDITKIYATPKDAFAAIQEVDLAEAKRFWKLYKAGDTKAAGEILRIHGGRAFQATSSFSPFDGGTMHGRFRDNRGRIRTTRVMQVVSDPGELKKYVKERQKRVGHLASGWLQAANRVGARVPEWVRRQGALAGSVRVETANNRFVIVMISKVSYAARQGQQNRANFVMAKRKKALDKRMPHILRSAAKKAGLK